MQYIDSLEVAKQWGLSPRTIRNFCSQAKIPGARRVGKQWMIPADAQIPPDGRTRRAKAGEAQYLYRFPELLFSEAFVSRAELSEDELLLLEAQILYFEGKYAESIHRCYSLIGNHVTPNIRFGAYLTIASSNFSLGINTSYHAAMRKMEEICTLDPTHTEDYRLSMEVLKYYITRDPLPLSKINVTRLSRDAILFYQISMMLLSTFSTKKETFTSVAVFESVACCAKRDRILPAQFMLDLMIGITFSRKRDAVRAEAYIREACEIACHQGWLRYLAKYYSASPSLISRFLTERGSNYLAETELYAESDAESFVRFRRVETGNPAPDLFFSESELLHLIAHDLTDEQIAIVLHTEPGQVEKKILALCQAAGVSDRTALKEFAEREFSRLES